MYRDNDGSYYSFATSYLKLGIPEIHQIFKVHGRDSILFIVFSKTVTFIEWFLFYSLTSKLLNFN